MNMVGMNPAIAGGPVGGMGMMNNGSPASSNTSSQEATKRLNSYIYEYFVKMGLHNVARSMVTEKVDMSTRPSIKQSPGRGKGGDVNGVDADAMEMDLKDDIPDDLPRPMVEGQGNGFLFDWFCIFSDLFQAQRKPGPGEMGSAARQYLQQTQSIQRQRESQQSQNLLRPNMVNAQQFAAMQNMRNGMMNGNMKQRLNPQQLNQFNASQQQMAIAKQQQMQRDHSAEMDMNGRPGTPAEGENGGSPSKRQRLDGPPFNGAMGPNGRPGMPGVQQQMLMQTGFNPNAMNQAQFRQNGAMQQKAMQGQMGNAMMNMGNPGSPGMMPMADGQFPANGIPVDMYNNQRMPGQPMQAGPGGQGGNHALQDYQMQLMLLEQQNKKRLMMARQEQDNITNKGDGPPFPGQGGMQPPGMSPSGSRSGTSPNPAEQMKRGNTQLGMPGSPAAGDIMQGRSPAAMNFINGGMGNDFNPAMFMKQGDGMMPGAPGMRPSTTMEMNAMRAQPGRMPGQFPGGQPMVQNPSQGPPQPMGTPGQRNDMPPPPTTSGPGNVPRAQPASPQQNQAPPTPSQTNKANPKKKGKEGDRPKKPNKKNSTANAPADSDPPATPTPNTPITPQHPGSFNNSAGKAGMQGAGAQNPGPTSNPAPVQAPQIQPDLQNAGFPDFSAPDQQFNLDFSTLETGDVLENFDFDTFLNTNTDDGGFSFGDGLAVENFGLDPGVE